MRRLRDIRRGVIWTDRGRMDGWTDGRTDRRTDGWTDKLTEKWLIESRSTQLKIQILLLITINIYVYGNHFFPSQHK